MSVDMAVKVLDESINKVVLIKLKGGKTLRGSLLGFDQHMNLLLDQSEEIPIEGETKTLGTHSCTRRQCGNDFSTSIIIIVSDKLW